MNIIDKMERRFGHLAIPGLIRYILGISILGNILNVLLPGAYYYLNFDAYKILHGQVWRLVTFLMAPSVARDNSFFIDLVWFLIWMSLYYYVGTNLENMWGAFRFNLYYFTGIFLIWVVGFAGYFVYASQYGAEFGDQLGTLLGLGIRTDALNLSLFLAFAAMFPDIQFLLYFIIPVKAKWLGILDLIYLGYQFFDAVMNRNYMGAALIVASIANFAIYFFFGRGGVANPKVIYKRNKRRQEYRKKAGRGSGTGPIHRCAVCGRTELDAPNLEFRYCSKCEGNYEYCSDHLFTHTHVHR